MALCNKWNVRYVQSSGTAAHDIGKKK